MDISTILSLIFTNIMVIGQDICLFISINLSNGKMYFTTFQSQAGLPISLFHFIPQAWTLGLELSFYIVAPLIVRKKTPVIVLLLFVSLATRYYLYYKGYYFGWWTVAFFPTELAMFLLGSISYRIFNFISDKLFSTIKISFFISIPIFLATILFHLLPTDNVICPIFSTNQIIYYALITISLPFLFIASKGNKIDRFIGELSYPLYLCHLIVIPFFGKINSPDKSITDIAFIIILSVILSIISVFLILQPINRYRQKRVVML